jgi:hypothetical protein
MSNSVAASWLQDRLLLLGTKDVGNEALQASESASAEEFVALKKKYGVESYSSKSPADRLFLILKRIDENHFENKDGRGDKDLKWLREKGLTEIFATYCERAAAFYVARFSKQDDPIHAIMACKYYRKLHRPKDGLEIIKRALCSRNPVESREIYDPCKETQMLLTNMGACHKDLGVLDEAERLGLLAIETYDKLAYPFNLLGAVYFRKGDWVKGNLFFDEANKRPPSNQRSDLDSERKLALDECDPDTQKECARYLLSIDARRYAWTKKYLISHSADNCASHPTASGDTP